MYENLLFVELIYFMCIYVSYKYNLWEFVHVESKLTSLTAEFECAMLPNFNYIY